MPKLDTTLHLDMYRAGKKSPTGNLYGLEWGDPETTPPLAYVRDHFLLPYATQETTCLEIGPGGGRWTRYMLGVKRLYAVDFHQELLSELKSNFSPENLTFVKNNGNDFPEIPDGAIDFIFSFGTFVHLDVEIIDEYLRNMKTLLKSSSNVVIQYSDKSKPLARSNKTFSQNDPDTMRRLVSSHGYSIYEEDITTLWHSSVIRFGTREADA